MSAIGYPFSVGADVGINANASVAVGPLVANGQSFQTIPLPNSQLALYRINISAPGGSQQTVRSWTFPISPRNLMKTFTAMANIYDVAGPSSTNGVTRVVDMYGNSPVTYKIEGTTGWQSHSTDGFAFTGMQSIADIVSALNYFAQANATQLESNNSDLYTMQFFDYFSNEYWNVVPIGQQIVRQDESKPLLFFYSFTFAGVSPVTDALKDTVNDPVQSALSVSTSQAISSLNTSVNSTLDSYVNNTAGGLGDLLDE